MSAQERGETKPIAKYVVPLLKLPNQSREKAPVRGKIGAGNFEIGDKNFQIGDKNFEIGDGNFQNGAALSRIGDINSRTPRTIYEEDARTFENPDWN